MFKIALGRDLLLVNRRYVSLFPDTRCEVLIERHPFLVRLAWREPPVKPRPVETWEDMDGEEDIGGEAIA
jgi:hypothetical protein